jgi:hypothetical protein
MIERREVLHNKTGDVFKMLLIKNSSFNNPRPSWWKSRNAALADSMFQ